MNSETILLATQGDCEALRTVLENLDSRMDRMCIRRRLTENGHYVYETDVYMKGEMQQKLLTAILKFKPAKDKVM